MQLAIFSIGLLCVVVHKNNFIRQIIGIEITIIATLINLISYPSYYEAYVFGLVVIAISAAETAIALSIFAHHQKKQYT